jgi:hypothetical protein
MGEYGEVKARLAALEREWFDLSAAIEAIESENTEPAPAKAPRRRHGG